MFSVGAPLDATMGLPSLAKPTVSFLIKRRGEGNGLVSSLYTTCATGTLVIWGYSRLFVLTVIYTEHFK